VALGAGVGDAVGTGVAVGAAEGGALMIVTPAKGLLALELFPLTPHAANAQIAGMQSASNP